MCPVEAKSVDEKLNAIGVGAGGQRVSSVVRVTEWNFAKHMIVADLLGPE